MRRHPLVALTVFLLATAIVACVPGEEHTGRYDRFARAAISKLAVSGLQGLAPILKVETARMANVPAAVAEMQRALPPWPPDTVLFTSGDIVMEHGLTIAKLVYEVRKGNQASRVDIWIEDAEGQLLIETLRVVALDDRS